MTREEHIKWCRTCTRRQMDIQKGLVCSLTGVEADFEGQCPDFEKDEVVAVRQLEEVAPHEVSAHLSQEKLESLRAEQNLTKGILGGVVAGIVGAVLWGIISVGTGYQIGFMPLAIGYMVGYAMRETGKGIDQHFGIIGGAIALLSCVLGNYFTVVGFVSSELAINLQESATQLGIGLALQLMGENFSIIDILFYGIAAVEGYKFAFRQLSARELSSPN